MPEQGDDLRLNGVLCANRRRQFFENVGFDAASQDELALLGTAAIAPVRVGLCDELVMRVDDQRDARLQIRDAIDRLRRLVALGQEIHVAFQRLHGIA